jgi:hypothetical protein
MPATTGLCKQNVFALPFVRRSGNPAPSEGRREAGHLKSCRSPLPWAWVRWQYRAKASSGQGDGRERWRPFPQTPDPHSIFLRMTCVIYTPPAKSWDSGTVTSHRASLVASVPSPRAAIRSGEGACAPPVPFSPLPADPSWGESLRTARAGRCRTLATQKPCRFGAVGGRRGLARRETPGYSRASCRGSSPAT